MYDISDQLYIEVAEQLLSRLGQQDYFSGVLEFEHANVLCRMVVSVVIYRRCERREEGDVRLISDMVPVWWEFHTMLDSGEVLNDFSFNTLRKYLKD